jgi:hypothetical protein
VLLVDHDQPQLAERQEQRRAGPDHDPRPAAGHALPDPPALGRGDARVPFGRHGAEPHLETAHHRLGQGDLGQQDQDLAVGILGQGGGDRLQIDLGLARAGDAVQQRRLEAALPQHLAQHVGAGLLAGVERLGRQGEIGRREAVVGLDEFERQRALLDQPLHHPRRHAGDIGQGRAGHRTVLGGGQHLQPGRRHAGGLGSGQDQHLVGLGRRMAQAAQGHGQGPAGNIDRIARRPVDEGQDAGRQGRVVELFQHRLQRPIAARPIAQGGDHAANHAGPQRHGHVVAQSQVQALGLGVVEGLRQRHGQKDGGDARHGKQLLPRKSVQVEMKHHRAPQAGVNR